MKCAHCSDDIRENTDTEGRSAYPFVHRDGFIMCDTPRNRSGELVATLAKTEAERTANGKIIGEAS